MRATMHVAVESPRSKLRDRGGGPVGIMHVLLISNSTQYGRGYLDHVEAELRDFLGGARRVVFAPFAVFDRKAYVAKARTRFAALGLDLQALEGPSTLDVADAI